MTIKQLKVDIEDLNETITLKDVEIENLKTKIAAIETLYSDNIKTNSIDPDCPPGTFPRKVISNLGDRVICE